MGRLYRKVARVALSIGAASFGLCGAIAPAGAGVGSDMEQAFQDMGAAANVSGPTAYQGQSAGYYSLGSAWTRFPQKTVYPANLQLPKVTAGCGGIDVFTGSFSFINADEFVAMLKAVANNAIGFAFKLAIEAISPQIGKTMQDLQDLANKINQANISSCETAQSLVGGMAGEMGIQSSTVCSAVGNSQGIFSDWARSKQKCGNGGQQSSTLSQANGALKDQVPGPKNYAWDIIKASALGSESVQMREMLMTLTGTIIVPARTSDGAEIQVVSQGPKVGPILDALIDGVQQVTIYKCDESTACMAPIANGQNFGPLNTSALKPLIRALIQSMADKLRTDQELTVEERNLLGMASIPLYKVLAVQAASGFQLAPTEIDTLAEFVAIDMLNAMMTNMLDQIAASRGALEARGVKGNIDAFMAQLRDVRTQLAQRNTSTSERVNRTFQIVDNAMRIETTLQTKMAPGMAASLNFSRSLSAQGLRP